ncbi:urease accessory protein [Thauera propionica]|jgi:urease accessory protein|uniref:Urease accessory protein n=1 Tax=Thauera propionica TaxID=2019431 RepID=A0A235F1T2_9RHOO|nr:HupE/UreJ family protein [Thauera propionica]MDD3674664.1 HupE/UreJ family protein [Thauera propionica]OYD55249.1 urease accessory protein [Thauera propionica]
MKTRSALAAVVLATASGAALAHPGHESASFFTGFTHPLGGLDHLLAMLAVGLYAARQPGATRWMLPAGFVLAMLAGAGLGAIGVALPAVEAGIAASMLVFGLLIALAARLPLTVSLPLVAAFALFHGHAHHAEMGGASLVTYAAGFALATALLHGAGYAIARWMPETRVGNAIKRVAGLLVAGVGGAMLGA